MDRLMMMNSNDMVGAAGGGGNGGGKPVDYSNIADLPISSTATAPNSSRDIPQDPSRITMDPRAVPVPTQSSSPPPPLPPHLVGGSVGSSGYQQHPLHSRHHHSHHQQQHPSIHSMTSTSKLDRFINEVQFPVVVGILFFLFQLQWCPRFITAMFDGILHTTASASISNSGENDGTATTVLTQQGKWIQSILFAGAFYMTHMLWSSSVIW